MKLSKFEKDRDEQARCKFTCATSLVLFDYHIYRAISNAIWSTSVYLVWAQTGAYRHTMFPHTANIEWAQEGPYNNTMFHYTANITWT